MIPVSPMFREAVLLSHTYFTKIDVYRMRKNGPALEYDLVAEDIKFTGGSLTSDRGSNSRLSCDFEVALNTWENLNIDPLTCRFRVFRGVSSIGFTELLQLGEFRVESISRTTSRGTVPIKGVGLENYIIDGRFLAPRAPQYGAMTTASIAGLINEILPNAEVVAMSSEDRRVLLRAPWDRERWDAVDSLAKSINAEVFVDWSGRFIIRDIPNFSNSGPAFTLKVGEGGAVIMPTSESDRATVYNAVVATTDPTDSAIAPVSYTAYDSTAGSPTEWGGPFGMVPTFIVSQFFRTTLQCQIAAQNALAMALAQNRKVSLELLPLVYPEAGDAFELTLEDGQPEIHIIQSITTPLSGGSSSMETLATKTDTEAEAG